MSLSDEFIAKLPKTDLHVHLDGSLRLKTLIELAQEIGLELPSYDEAELRAKVFPEEGYSSLEEYLQGFQYTTGVMRTRAALTRVAFEFAEDNYAEGVRYFECRFSPQLLAGTPVSGMSIEEVISAVNDGFSKAKAQFNAQPGVVSEAEPPYEYGIIVCAMRLFVKEMSPYYAAFLDMHKHEDEKRVQSLASMALVTAAVQLRDEGGLPIVALDIAGAEAGFPASVHRPAFEYAHENFMHKTVHAGEAWGPQSVFQAMTALHADRIGHGLHLFDVESVRGMEAPKAETFVKNLSRFVAERRTLVEVCLSSNMHTKPELKLENHPVRRMLKNRISVSLCTDNRLVSNTTVCKEMRLARDALDLSARDLKDMVIGGFKRSFFPGDYVTKRAYIRRVIDFYESLEKEYGVSCERCETPVHGVREAITGDGDGAAVAPPEVGAGAGAGAGADA